MSLVHGLILSTLNSKDSQHSQLMRFYELDKEIAKNYNTRSYKECFHDVNLYFMEIEARAILKALNIN